MSARKQTISVDFDGVTDRKLAAIAYIDDRGIRFTSWLSTLHTLANLT